MPLYVITVNSSTARFEVAKEVRLFILTQHLWTGVKVRSKRTCPRSYNPATTEICPSLNIHRPSPLPPHYHSPLSVSLLTYYASESSVRTVRRSGTSLTWFRIEEHDKETRCREDWWKEDRRGTWCSYGGGLYPQKSTFKPSWIQNTTLYPRITAFAVLAPQPKLDTMPSKGGLTKQTFITVQ